MSFVVLNYLLLSEVEHRDGLIGSTCQYALSSWMEGSASDGSIEAIIFLHLFSLFNIPNNEFFVFSS